MHAAHQQIVARARIALILVSLRVKRWLSKCCWSLDQFRGSCCFDRESMATILQHIVQQSTAAGVPAKLTAALGV